MLVAREILIINLMVGALRIYDGFVLLCAYLPTQDTSQFEDRKDFSSRYLDTVPKLPVIAFRYQSSIFFLFPPQQRAA